MGCGGQYIIEPSEIVVQSKSWMNLICFHTQGHERLISIAPAFSVLCKLSPGAKPIKNAKAPRPLFIQGANFGDPDGGGSQRGYLNLAAAQLWPVGATNKQSKSKQQNSKNQSKATKEQPRS